MFSVGLCSYAARAFDTMRAPPNETLAPSLGTLIRLPSPHDVARAIFASDQHQPPPKRLPRVSCPTFPAPPPLFSRIPPRVPRPVFYAGLSRGGGALSNSRYSASRDSLLVQNCRFSLSGSQTRIFREMSLLFVQHPLDDLFKSLASLFCSCCDSSVLRMTFCVSRFLLKASSASLEEEASACTSRRVEQRVLFEFQRQRALIAVTIATLHRTVARRAMISSQLLLPLLK